MKKLKGLTGVVSIVFLTVFSLHTEAQNNKNNSSSKKNCNCPLTYDGATLDTLQHKDHIAVLGKNGQLGCTYIRKNASSFNKSFSYSWSSGRTAVPITKVVRDPNKPVIKPTVDTTTVKVVIPYSYIDCGCPEKIFYVGKEFPLESSEKIESGPTYCKFKNLVFKVTCGAASEMADPARKSDQANSALSEDTPSLVSK